MRIFFSVGEPSGDLHGSNLIQALRRRHPEIECVGYGGPKMRAAGAELHEDLTRLAVMGIGPVIVSLSQFLSLASRADRFFRHHRPDALVLIDYPGFNWWIAWRAKVHGIPVFYYGAPQLWAWASWRVRKMRRLTDHVLCKLPFEESWFRARGCNATYFGHPYFDQLNREVLDQSFLDNYGAKLGPLVTILPGSRTQEVKANLRWFLRAAKLVGQAVPVVRFAIASYNPKQAELARTICGRENIAVDVMSGRTPELIHLAHCCMACSGSVSLELLFHCKPTVIHYWINQWLYYTLRRLVKAKYITLVNLLADEAPFENHPLRYDPATTGAENVLIPEYPTCVDRSHEVAAHVTQWLTDEEKRITVVNRLRTLKGEVCASGASSRGAAYILEQLDRRRTGVVRPHDLPLTTAAKLPQDASRAA